MQDTLSFDVARWIARRIPRHVDIAWNDYEEDRALGTTLSRFVPLLKEDADVGSQYSLDVLAGRRAPRERPLDCVIRRFEQLPVTDRERGNSTTLFGCPFAGISATCVSRATRNWKRPHRFYYHTEPLITRSQVLLAERTREARAQAH